MAFSAFAALYVAFGVGQLYGPGWMTILAGLSICLLCIVTWYRWLGFLPLAEGSSITALRPQSLIVFVPFFSLLVFFPEYIFGHPSLSRVILIFLLCATLCCSLGYLLASTKQDSLTSFLNSHSLGIIIGIVTCHAIVFTSLTLLRQYNFGAAFGEDTGYYNQIFWSSMRGEFFRGSLMQARYVDPPVVSEFQVHNSPIIMLILPLYALLPGVYTLVALRTIVVSLSAIPIYLLAKETTNGLVAIIVGVTYLLSTGVLYQSIGAFYPLQFVMLLFPMAVLYFWKRRFGLFVLSLVLCLFVREEVALTLLLFGVYAVMVRRPWPWIVTPLLLACAWWLISTKLVMNGSKIAMEELDAFFKSLGGSYNEIVTSVVKRPWVLVDLMFTRQNAEYVYAMVKPTSGLMFGSMTILYALPTLVINAIVGSFWKATLRPDMHYSVIVIISSFCSAVFGIRYISQRVRFMAVRPALVQVAFSTLLIPPAIIGVKDVFELDRGRDSALLEEFSRKPFQNTLERMIAAVARDPDASVAAPSLMLPQLSERTMLYCADWLWRYENPQLDYIIFDVRSLARREVTSDGQKYRATVSRVRMNAQYRLVLAENGFELYRRDSGSRLELLPGDSSKGHRS